MDSSHAQGLEGVSTRDIQRIAESFVDVCYTDMAKAPRFLDGHDMHGALGHLLPSRFKEKFQV